MVHILDEKVMFQGYFQTVKFLERNFESIKWLLQNGNEAVFKAS